MKKTLIITSYLEHEKQLKKEDLKGFHTIICADGGYIVADRLGLTPHYIIGDFDSSKNPGNETPIEVEKTFTSQDLQHMDFQGKRIITLPKRKDMTDTEAALVFAMEKGATSVNVLGGIGGRLDHTLGNMALLARYVNSGCNLLFFDGQNSMRMLAPGSHTIEKGNFKYTGLASWTPVCTGITLSGFKYNAEDLTLTFDTTLGISNEIIDEKGTISLNEGLLMVAMSKDMQ